MTRIEHRDRLTGEVIGIETRTANGGGSYLSMVKQDYRALPLSEPFQCCDCGGLTRYRLRGQSFFSWGADCCPWCYAAAFGHPGNPGPPPYADDRTYPDGRFADEPYDFNGFTARVDACVARRQQPEHA